MSELTDEMRYNFILALDEASDVTVSEWEASFMDSIITKAMKTFSPKMQNSIDQMIDRYDSKVQW